MQSAGAQKLHSACLGLANVAWCAGDPGRSSWEWVWIWKHAPAMEEAPPGHCRDSFHLKTLRVVFLCSAVGWVAALALLGECSLAASMVCSPGLSHSPQK